MLASVWSWLEGIDAEAWSAAAAWSTLLVALLAARVAYGQLQEAARLRREQAQPTSWRSWSPVWPTKYTSTSC